MSARSDERFAPEGWLWVCCACGKTAKDLYGLEGQPSPGWDESCMLNAILADERSCIRGDDGRVVEIKPDDGEAA